MCTEMIFVRTIEEFRDLAVEKLIKAVDSMPPDQLVPPGC